MSVLQALVAHYERLLANNEAPEYGYSYEAISFAIVLSASGEPVDVMDCRNTTGRTPRPTRQYLVPSPSPSRTGRKVVPNVLWDNTGYALGVTGNGGPGDAVLSTPKHEAFKHLHLELLGNSEDAGLRALTLFLQQWNPERFVDPPFASFAADMLGSNVIFRLAGIRGFIHESPAARCFWRDHLGNRDGAEGVCLVTGQHAPIARLHPPIKGVRGARSSGARVVSFNLESFKSFGRQQGNNAPISEPAAFAYTTALNSLLSQTSSRRIQIGDTTTVFWAEARKAEELVAAFLEPPPDDDTETVLIRDMLEKLSCGMPLQRAAPDIDQGTRYYLLGLSPNAARLSVRFWLEGMIDELVAYFAQHWRDLLIYPAPRKRLPTVRDLVNETAVVITRPDGRREKNFDTVSPLLAGSLMRALLTGQGYPRTLMSTIIMRLRSDGQISDLRATILKACIVRDLRIQKQLPQEDYLVSLDRNSNNMGYNLGRLFAAFAYAERSFADRNASIRDKYMGAASTTPRRVFPILMRGYENNRAGLAKMEDKRGAGVRADQAVGQIMDLLPGRDELPATLLLEDQARFFVGYYHQERDFYTKSDSAAHLGPQIISRG